jgi:hypothetical protein
MNETFFLSVLLRRLLILCYTWLVLVLGYYGLSLTSVSIAGDPYLNFFLVSFIEVPGRLTGRACEKWPKVQPNLFLSNSIQSLYSGKK